MFLSKLFSKDADHYLVKGDKLYRSQSYFEARSAYEDGLRVHIVKVGPNGGDDVSEIFSKKIALSNRSLAGLNIKEAEYAISSGAIDKAIEYLELAKTLTDDLDIREKAEKLQETLIENTNETSKLAVPVSGCNSCSTSRSDVHADSSSHDPGLLSMDYYDLLIRQLPVEMYSRYAVLGEKFACAYLASSNDDYVGALSLLEAWHDGSNRDIFYYEKGMILHRLGNLKESETCLRDAVSENNSNPLPHIGLALLLIDAERFDEAILQLDSMISAVILADQALLLRGDVSLYIGDVDGAILRYSMLLSTPLVRSAAEKLYEVLMYCGREQEGTVVYKQYLKGCGGH